MKKIYMINSITGEIYASEVIFETSISIFYRYENEFGINENVVNKSWENDIWFSSIENAKKKLERQLKLDAFEKELA